MNIFQRMEDTRRRRVCPPSRTEVTYKSIPDTEAYLSEDHWEWRWQVSVGCKQFGPESSREEMAKRARRMIARELYGEIQDDLMELLEYLYEESYRTADDPVLGKLGEILRKISGDL